MSKQRGRCGLSRAYGSISHLGPRLIHRAGRGLLPHFSSGRGMMAVSNYGRGMMAVLNYGRGRLAVFSFGRNITKVLTPISAEKSKDNRAPNITSLLTIL